MDDNFKSIAMVAKLGDIFGKSKKDKMVLLREMHPECFAE